MKWAVKCKGNVLKKEFYVYILANQYNNVIYVGVTSDLLSRVCEHKNGTGSAYTSKYKVNKLVYYEILGDAYSAIEREKYLKGKKRIFKERLINEINPSWDELKL